MTAKKRAAPKKQPATKKTADKAPRKTAGKRSAKKTQSNAPNPASKAGEHGSPFAPELLAALAVKLVRLKEDAPAGSPGKISRLAYTGYDDIFIDALKRAEMLLLAASGRSNEDVHAYPPMPPGFNWVDNSRFYLASGLEMGPMLFAVPEPASLLLAAMSLGWITTRRRVVR